MYKKKGLKKIFLKRMILPILAILTFGLSEIASRNSSFIEIYYSQTIYPKVAEFISFISNLFPFSLDDLFYLLLITAFLSLILLLIFRKISLTKASFITLNSLSAIYILFYFLWGFNYFRNDLNERFDLAEQNPDTDVFLHQLEALVESTNNSFCSSKIWDKNDIDSLLEQTYNKLSPVLKIDYPSGKRKDKKITFSRFFSKAGISGYYGPFFNEVHVNTYILPLEYPFVLAHEKAHQFGVTSEAEANFYAWLVCTESNSKQLQYSANLHILRFFLYQGYQLERYPEIISKLNENVKVDFRRISENWDKLRNEKVDKVASKVNDTYLKSNKVEKGIEDYFGVVKFVMDFSLDSAFQKKYDLNLN
jgi:hypothetical protein